MQQGLLFSLFLSLLLIFLPASAVEISSASQNKLVHDAQLQAKVSELVDLALKDDIDSLSFAIQRIALPQQEAARYLLLQYMEEHQVALSTQMVRFIELQKSIVPVYQVLEKGEGYEFSVPAFDYIAIAHRLLKQWKQDQSVIDFKMRAENQELDLHQWLSGPDHLVQEREELFLREFDGLSVKAKTALVEQMTEAKVVSWLPSSEVMVKMVQVTQDTKLYKLLWLMRADFYIEQELVRLSNQSNDFSTQQLMIAASNPRLSRLALQNLVKTSEPLSDEVKDFLVRRLQNSSEAPIVAQALAEQGYDSWLKELLQNNHQVESQAILQVLTQ